MGAFILAGLFFVGSVLLAFFVALAQSMAAAPQYDNSPWVILGIGTALSILVAASHWIPHIGW
jgi:hypothetical protein